MALTEPSLRRLKPVRLTDIPFDVRCRAAREIAQREPAHAHSVLLAALTPSNTTYWIKAA